MVINKKVKRTMLEHKSQYIGSIILIIIGCMLYSCFNIAMVDAQDNLQKFRTDHNLEDASFIVQNPILNLQELETKFDLTLEERKSTDFNYDSESVLRLLQSTNKLDKYAVIKGRRLQNNDEILIDPGFAKAHSLSVNDTFKINKSTFEIVGFMTTPDYVYPLKSENDVLKNPKAFGVAVVGKEDIGKIGPTLTYYSVKYNQPNSDEFIKNLSNENILIQWVNKKDNNRISFVDGDLKGGVAVGKDLPIAILLLSCILISVILTRLIKGEYQEIGTLYALGYTKKEIMGHYFRYSLIMSVVGSAIGTISGGLLVKPLLSMVTSFYNLPLLAINYDVKYIIFSFLLPFVFLLPVTYIVINRALKLSPVQLMRGGVQKTKVNFIEKSLKLDRFKFNTKFKIREMVRSLPRTMLMIFGVTFASMLLLLGFATKDSMDYMVKSSYIDIYQYNYQYTFNALQSGTLISGEKRSLSTFTANLNQKDENLVIFGVEKDSKLINLVDSSDNHLSFDQVIITKSMSDKYGLKEGDSVQVKNKLNSKNFTLRIDKIAKAYTGDVIYMPLNDFNQLNGYPENSYLQIDSKDQMNIPADKLLSESNRQDMIDGYNALLMPMKYMIGGIAAMAFIIGLIVIYVVTSLVIEENKANISMFKILGYSNKEVFSLILSSNTLLVIIGFTISVPLILVTLKSFFDAMTKDMNITIPTQLNNINILVGFVIIMITYELSKALNRKKVLNVSMADCNAPACQDTILKILR
ncbi:MAG TPA: FtsX-like permease family protein [Desulfosporosinus sp.]|nr:FtsX-like permease family protein [Desulfosporosinus sp.]